MKYSDFVKTNEHTEIQRKQITERIEAEDMVEATATEIARKHTGSIGGSLPYTKHPAPTNSYDYDGLLDHLVNDDDGMFKLFGMNASAIIAFKEYYTIKGGVHPITLDSIVEAFEGLKQEECVIPSKVDFSPALAKLEKENCELRRQLSDKVL